MAYETDAAGANARQVVVGLFDNSNDAQQAVTELRAKGFTSGEIGAAFRSTAVEPYSTERSTASTKTGAVKQNAENWWERVKDAFRSDDSVENRREVAAASEPGADPYGTGRY